MYTVYYYPSCNTCKKALKWLEAHEIEVQKKHMVEETPSAKVLKDILEKTKVPSKKLFNTSGKLYRELNMKEKQAQMTEEEVLSMLSGEGMLIKRPLLVGQDVALIGFKEKEWKEKVR